VVALALALPALVLASCTDDESSSATTTTAPPPDLVPLDGARAAELAATVDAAPDCDPLDTTACLLPFPSDRFTVADRSSETGRRVALPEGVIANVAGAALDVTEWNRNDGFSPGSPIIVNAVGVDPARSGLPPIGDIGASMEDASASVLLDMETGERLPHWAELDATPARPDQQLLMLHPAKALPLGHRIAVALRGLWSTDGTPLIAPLAFEVYRDGLATDIDAVETRRDGMEEVIGALVADGTTRSDLWMAWDFTVVSDRNLTERLVAMRDDAFDRVGEEGPSFTVDEVVTDPAELEDGIARLVRGTFVVPSYLTGDAGPGSRLHYEAGEGAADATPTASDTEYTAAFSCQIPTVAVEGQGGTSRAVVYGHGLLGSHEEVENSQVAKLASTNDMTYCATDWIGMSQEDIGQALVILQDLSEFPTLADRSQQGILNTALLGRLMVGTKGLSTHEAFRTASGETVLDTSEVYFDGNSQGSIMGGAATAIAPDWSRATLGVAGMNYALLLSRSTDFTTYFAALRNAYPDRVEQQIIYGLMQMLWDRAETSGYAAHLGDDPLPDTPDKQVLLHVAFGDHQVAQVAAEIEARTIGARIHQPALADGRHPDAHPFYGFTAMPDGPWGGNALVYWDSGTLAPPPENITPVSSPAWISTCGGMTEDQWKADPRCADSHEDPRRAPDSIEQKDLFFRPDGAIEDTCDGKPCVAVPRSQLDY
jgi:hypothetical protein